MELKSLISDNKVIDIEHPEFPGFVVSIAYVSREQYAALAKKATTLQYDKRTHKPDNKLDMDLLAKLQVKATIKGWTGLKLRYLLDLLPIDLPEDTDLDETELDYSEDNALTLITDSVAFDSWVSSVASEVKNFNKSFSTKK